MSVPNFPPRIDLPRQAAALPKSSPRRRHPILCAPKYAARPQAVAADGEGIAEAILFVFLRQLAPSAIRARRKVELTDALAKGCIFRMRPNRRQTLIGQTAEFAPAEILYAAPDKTAVGVQERRTGADTAMPCDGKASGLDEGAVLFRWFRLMSRKLSFGCWRIT